MENRRDFSISMERANLIVLFTTIPVVVAQFGLFTLIHGTEALETTWNGDWLILWLLRNVKSGVLVEDHPTNAGCYFLQPGT